MGVPNTTTFTLQNVLDVVTPTTDDLVDCFADATAAKFDSTYSGDKDKLLNFRNYDGGLPSFLGSVETKDPCAGTMNITYYHNGSGTNPAVGDTVYTNASGTTTYSQGNMRANFGAFDGSSAIVFQVSNNGIISSISDCSPP